LSNAAWPSSTACPNLPSPSISRNANDITVNITHSLASSSAFSLFSSLISFLLVRSQN
jgi:hypothetical protein